MIDSVNDNDASSLAKVKDRDRERQGKKKRGKTIGLPSDRHVVSGPHVGKTRSRGKSRHLWRAWQDELAEMEKTLLAMDEEDEDLDPLSLQSRRRDRERTEEPSRASLIQKIDSKLKDYGTSTMRLPRGQSL